MIRQTGPARDFQNIFTIFFGFFHSVFRTATASHHYPWAERGGPSIVSLRRREQAINTRRKLCNEWGLYWA